MLRVDECGQRIHSNGWVWSKVGAGRCRSTYFWNQEGLGVARVPAGVGAIKSAYGKWWAWLMYLRDRCLEKSVCGSRWECAEKPRRKTTALPWNCCPKPGIIVTMHLEKSLIKLIHNIYMSPKMDKNVNAKGNQ